MADYVLDENIILFAAKVSDTEDKMDFSCASLMMRIVERCDTIHCSGILIGKYWKKLKELEETTRSAAFTKKMLLKLQTKEGSIKYYDDPPPIKDIDEREVPEDDLFLIRLVVHSRAILITADCKLEDRLKKKNLISKYSIRIEKPWEQQLAEK